MRRRKTSAGSFVATDDLGRKFTVHIYACRTFADLELRLSDGTKVDRLGKGEYEVSRETVRIVLRCAHPKAP